MPKIIGKDGKVTCCYDFLKVLTKGLLWSKVDVAFLSFQGRCHRDYCKYYHPPAHIKERLVSAGRQFGAMMSRTPLYSAAMVAMFNVSLHSRILKIVIFFFILATVCC